jgi:hypothetical protein
MSRRVLIASLVLAAGAIAAANALATNLGDAGGVSYRYQADHVPAGRAAKAVAHCPRGKSPSGGGYQIFSDMGLSQYEAAGSKPFDGADRGHVPDDGWEVSGEQADHGVTAASYTICTRGEHRYVSKARPAEGLSRVKVECPGPSWNVTGGGGTLGKPASSALIAGFPFDGGDLDTKPDDGWEAWGYAPVNDKLRAFVVCAHTRPAYHSATKSLDPGSGSRLTAMCGAGRHLLGVGGKAGETPAQTALVQLATPDDFNHDQVYDDAGAIFATNSVNAPSAVDAQAFAICTP